jgi:hypothetical protein
MPLSAPPSQTTPPTPPQRSDPANFAVRGDGFLAWIVTWFNELLLLIPWIRDAAAICESAAQAVNVSEWISGTTYAVGENRFDPVTFLTYRRKTAGAGTTRPGLDGTNWQLLTSFGDVDSVSDQTIGGSKTFSAPPVVPNDSFALAKLQNIATGRLLGRITAGSGDIEELTVAQAAELLSALSAGEVGSLSFLRYTGLDAVEQGTVVSGGLLRYSNANGSLTGTAIPGSWRCLGALSTGSNQGITTLFIRIA